MTATATSPLSVDTWTAQLAKLKERFKHVRPPILAALNILLHDKDISLDDAKARANLHGVRITAASVNGARTLLSRMDGPPAATPKAAAATPAAPASAPTRAPRRARAAEPGIDAETLIRTVVAKIQGQGNVEAERLRDGLRKAIAVLQATLG